MMWPYYGGGGWWAMMLGGLVTWVLFVVVAGLLVAWALRAFSGPRRGPDAAIETLRRRLAAGEITPEEFETTRRMLE